MAIKFNHKEERIPLAMGVSRARELEIDDMIKEAIASDKTHATTEIIEYTMQHIKNVTESDILYIGFTIGCFMEHKRHAIKEKLSKVEEAIKKALE